MCERAGGRLWLDALAPRAQSTEKGPFGRARAYARTAAVSRLVIEPGTVRCPIDETTGSAPSSRTCAAQPHPTIHIPVPDQEQWRDLSVITRHLASRLARLPVENVLEEIAATGARNGIHPLPTFAQCRTSWSPSPKPNLRQRHYQQASPQNPSAPMPHRSRCSALRSLFSSALRSSSGTPA
ncbi:hypothetical protein [Streptomyces sp. B29(2018)]|uniref:hypothetical protein n=1 Tax=Streptomyces sp. B29(2018) TaxID=2485016 RepID=UPI000FD63D22|nr:hypothetical protein [Streptomyces sp. B29(2018)]